jgi:hypothetical protein
MLQFLLYLRILFEGMAGFLILLCLPFVAIGLLHSGAGMGFVLVGWLLLTIVFLLGILLFRDAVILRMRQKSRAAK